MALVDSQIDNPTKRALRIWNIIKSSESDPSEWDLICFACEVIAQFASTNEWLMPSAKRLNSLVYTAHYYKWQDLGIT